LAVSAAQANFEVEPQSRFKISVAGALAKDFVMAGGTGLEGTGVTKSLTALAGGGSLGIEYPIVSTFAVGLRGVALYEFAKAGASYYDLDGFLKFQFGFDEDSLSSNLYFMIPGGVSVMPWKEQFAEAGRGFNTGLILGSQFYFAERFGFFVDVGYLYRYIGERKLLKNPEFERSFHFHEVAANIGLSLGL
jgi:hypothetical protein